MQTLNSFFGFQKHSDEWVTQITGSEGFAPVRLLFSQDLPGFQFPPSFFELLVAKLPEAMDIDIAKVLVGGWRKHREIAQYRDITSPAEGYHEVALLEHTIKSEHSPTIQPIINGVAFPRVVFNITLALELTGGQLYIREGKIMKAKTGSCTGSGAITFKSLIIFEKKSKTFELPGKILFEPGIPI